MALDFESVYQMGRGSEINHDIRTAWFTAKLIRAAHVPDLADLLIETKKAVPKEMTAEEIMNACRMIAAAFGGVTDGNSENDS